MSELDKRGKIIREEMSRAGQVILKQPLAVFNDAIARLKRSSRRAVIDLGMDSSIIYTDLSSNEIDDYMKIREFDEKHHIGPNGS